MRLDLMNGGRNRARDRWKGGRMDGWKKDTDEGYKDKNKRTANVYGRADGMTYKWTDPIQKNGKPEGAWMDGWMDGRMP